MAKWRAEALARLAVALVLIVVLLGWAGWYFVKPDLFDGRGRYNPINRWNNDTVTLRDRDTMQQTRVKISDLLSLLLEKIR